MFIQCLLCDRYGGRNSPGAACLLGTWTSIRTSLRDTHRIAGLPQDRSEVYPGCHLPHVGPSLSLLILLSLEKLLPTLVDSNSPSPCTCFLPDFHTSLHLSEGAQGCLCLASRGLAQRYSLSLLCLQLT